MKMLRKLEKIVEAANRQGIVISDILGDGTVVSESEAYTRKYKLKESKKPSVIIEGSAIALEAVANVLMEADYEVEIGGDRVVVRGDVGEERREEIQDTLDTINTDMDGADLEMSEPTQEMVEAEEDDEEAELELDDEESKVEYDSKSDAAEGIVDNIIMGNFEDAHEALDDYIKMYMSDEGDSDVDGDGELNGEQSGLDDDYMLDVDDENKE